MENKYEQLREALEKMDVVTVKAACHLTGLSKKDVIDFVRENPSLRIFDDENTSWINEKVDGHC